MHFCVFTVPHVASVIILYVLCMTAWAEIVWLFWMIESMVLLRNNSQSEEWGHWMNLTSHNGRGPLLIDKMRSPILTNGFRLAACLGRMNLKARDVRGLCCVNTMAHTQKKFSCVSIKMARVMTVLHFGRIIHFTLRWSLTLLCPQVCNFYCWFILDFHNVLTECCSNFRCCSLWSILCVS